MAGTPTVGKNVDSWCTRCKMMLAHTIEAAVGGKITRVHCNTCGGQHAHRASPPGSGSATTRSRSATARGGAARPEQRPNNYAALLRGRDAAAAKPYAATDRYQAADLIKHPSFGLGVVTVLREGNKIDVVFAEGQKTLIHRR